MEDSLKDPYESTVEKPIIHTEQITISNKLYSLLDSLTIITTEDNITSDDNIIPDDVIYDIIIKDIIPPLTYKMYNGNKQIFITIKYNSYEIINNIEVYPPDKSQAITNKVIVMPQQAKVPYILSQKPQETSNLLKTRYTTIKTKFKFIDTKSYNNKHSYYYYCSNAVRPYEIKTETSSLNSIKEFMRSPDNI